jgi:hypothetical protein
MKKLHRFRGFPLSCFAACALACAHGAYAQSQTFYLDPQDPPDRGYSDVGAGVAVSGRTAAIGASGYEFYEGSDYSPPEWIGLVNVYEANAERTQWNLLAILHGEDASPLNANFGKAIAMDGRHLVVASNAVLRVYERRQGNYNLVDTLVLDDATISESAPIELARDVLAIIVLDNEGGSSLRIFHVSPRGKLRAVARLPGASRLSLNADGRSLAISATGGVYVYQDICNAWRQTAMIPKPHADAAGFGASVALSGKLLLVGAPYENEEYEDLENRELWAGAVYVYRKRSQGWTMVQRLATNEPSQPSYGRIKFGWEIVTNGRYVWITAPFAHDLFASEQQLGPASLYRWNAGELEFVAGGPNSYARGAIDMSRRYVIEGDIFSGGFQMDEGAHIVDLRSLAPADTGADGDADTDTDAGADANADTESNTDTETVTVAVDNAAVSTESNAKVQLPERQLRPRRPVPGRMRPWSISPES